MPSHWNKSPRVDMSPPRTHYADSEPATAVSLLLLLHTAEKQHNIIVFGFTLPGLEPTISRTRNEYASNSTTDAVSGFN